MNFNLIYSSSIFYRHLKNAAFYLPDYIFTDSAY